MEKRIQIDNVMINGVHNLTPADMAALMHRGRSMRNKAIVESIVELFRTVFRMSDHIESRHLAHN